MRIGLDFGTTYSKIAYIDADNKLQLFPYPGEQVGKFSIPTAVAYESGPGGRSVISIGEAARTKVGKPGVDYRENFKLLLPLADPQQWASGGWDPSRSPGDVTFDYLRRLLVDDRQGFIRERGPIESVVVSVPQLWQQSGQNPGATVLQNVVEQLGLSLDHLRGEPVCAAAYYAYIYPQLEGRGGDKSFEGTLLVCDVGGGTFDVTVCAVKGREIVVRDFDGNGEGGTGLAGVAFDRTAVALAYGARYGSGPPTDQHDAQFPAFLKLLREFEITKLNEHNSLEDNLRIYGADPLMAGTHLYTFGDGLGLSFQQIEEAFLPVQRGIHEVLQRVQDRMRQRGEQVDRLAIVGGFGQFPYTRRAIMSALNIPEEGDARFDARLNSRNMAYAVSCGAALIANGIMRPLEDYPHTVGIRLHQKIGGRWVEQFSPIVQAGHELAGGNQPHFMQEQGQPTVVEVMEGAAGALPVMLQPRGIGEPGEIFVPQPQFPPAGKYYVGLLLNRSNLARLVFRPVGGGPDLIYDLGNLDFKIIKK